MIRSLFCAMSAFLILLGCAPASHAISPHRKPGSWTMVHYTMAFEATGVEGGMADMVRAGKASIGQKDFGGPLCLSAEVAAKDDRTARLQEAIHFGPEWKVVRANVDGDGKVDFAAAMDDLQAAKGTMTIAGRLTPTDVMAWTAPAQA